MMDFRTFPLHGSRLIEASAGTGKTYTIAMLYVRLVLGHGGQAGFHRPLTPSEILVVTFTDAASQELRDRIRHRLAQAADWFRRDTLTETSDPLAIIWNDYSPSERAVAADRLQHAAESMDEAAVSTIHSWCYRMLREHAFDSGAMFQQELNANPSEILRQCAEDYWRQHFYARWDDEPLAQQITEQFKNPEELLVAVKPLLDKPYLITEYLGEPQTAPHDYSQWLDEVSKHAAVIQKWEQRLDEIADEARTAFSEDWPSIESILTAASLNVGTYHKGKSRQSFLASLRDEIQSGVFPSAENKKHRQLANGRFNVKKGSPQPEHVAFEVLGGWVDHLDQRPEALHPPLQVQLALHAAQWMARERERRMARRNELSFDDMLLRLHHALHAGEGHPTEATRPPADSLVDSPDDLEVGNETHEKDRPRQTEVLAAAIRRKYPVAMIDEFQDTDPIQYSIFDRIYRVQANDSQTAMIMIGDPKQAIYGFRGADIYTYLHAKQATATRTFSLGTNHRSTSAAVDAVNHWFSRSDRQPQGAFRYRTSTSDPIPFHPVTARGRQETLWIDGEQPAGITCWYLPGQNEHGVTGPADYRETMSAAAATEIVRWLKLSDQQRAGFAGPDQTWTRLRPRDIAILVRTGIEAASIRQALKRRGLPSVYLSDKESVFETIEAREMRRWLEAMAHPTDERRVKSGLATWILGLSLAELKHTIDSEELWETTITRFRRYQQVWRTVGVLPAIRSLMHDYSVPARLLGSEAGERTLTNVLHLAEWLQQASTQVEGEQALLRRLSQQIADPKEEQVLRLESDADLIKVITIHKSKGLEYPLVLLPFICSWRDATKSPQATFHRVPAPGQPAKLIMELGKNSADTASAYFAADRERLDEDTRLLYVALTRAQHAMWLGLTPLGKRVTDRTHCLPQTAIGYSLMGEQTWAVDSIESRLQEISIENPAIAVRPCPEVNLSRWTASQSRPLTGARVALPQPRPRWWVASYSALRTKEAPAPERAVDAVVAESLEELSELERPESNFPKAPEPNTTPGTMFDFPRGANAGTFLHDLLEWAAQRGFGRVAREATLRREHLSRVLANQQWDMWLETLDHWLQAFLSTELPLGDTTLRLCDLRPEHCVAEMEFWLELNSLWTGKIDRRVQRDTLERCARPSLENEQWNGMLKGFIDLIFRHGERYYIIDWKSNDLGSRAVDYDNRALRSAIAAKRYDMQYVLYSVALHRHLRHRLPGYDYERNIGGAAYCFLRGLDHPHTRGVHFERPPLQLIQELDRWFQGEGVDANDNDLRALPAATSITPSSGDRS